MTKEPLISVIMAVYNGERYLKESVDSILGQTFRTLEFIIVDDGSTDGTSDILGGYSDPRLKIVTQENQGLTRSLNTAIKLARGEFIARLDADDISEPTRLEKQVKFLQENQDVGMVGAWFLEIDGDGRVLGEKAYPTTDRDLRHVLVKYNPFCHSSVMMRRAALTSVGGYDESFKRAQDYDLWFRIAAKYKLANIAKYLLLKRYDSTNISIESENSQIAFAQKARRQAIRAGRYPFWSNIYLVRPFIVSHIPRVLKTKIRKTFLDSGQIHS